jgi:hypothetical protein
MYDAYRGVLLRLWLFFGVALLVASTRIEAACIDPSKLDRSTVSIERVFGEDERNVRPGEYGIGGTGWFFSPQLIVTAAHVAEAMHLSERDWKDVEFRGREGKGSIPVRIRRLVGSQSEKIAVLELKSSFSGAAALPLRTEPLVPDEHIVSLAYPKGDLRTAAGRFVRYGVDEDKLAGTALLEMHDGDDRLVLDHGASGAPVLDCEGRVVAVVTNLITQTITSQFGVMRVSTAWQSPNVVSIPIQALNDLSWSE